MVRSPALRGQRTWGYAPGWLYAALLFWLLVTTSAGADSRTPLGVWLHPNKRIQVQIFPCGRDLCGKIVWFRWPNDAQGVPLVDFKNKKKSLRSRPLLGLTVLRDLHHSGENMWTGGRIYNPDDGLDYAAQMSIQDNGTLRVRAYVLFPALGETLIWTRVR